MEKLLRAFGPRLLVATTLLCGLPNRGGAQTVEGDPAPASSADPEEPQPAPVPGYPKMVLLDAGHVLTSPFRWTHREWLLLGAYTAGLAVLSLADERISDDARTGGANLRFVGDTLEGLGDGRSFVLLGGFFLEGMLAKDEKAKNVCLDGLAASLIAAGTITPVLSTVVGRDRPTEENGVYTFHPFRGRSFPSGHATQVFAVVSVIATSYDQLWVKAAAYGAGIIGAWIRLERGKHFPTDLVAGAIIGTAVGRSVVFHNRKLRSGQAAAEGETAAPGIRLTLLPVVDRGTFGIGGRVEF